MRRRLRSFGAFWFDFVVGDDWRVAASVVIALAITFVLSRTTAVPTWWIVPLAVVAVLTLSLRREIRRAG